jgi:hypothetical protein
MGFLEFLELLEMGLTEEKVDEPWEHGDFDEDNEV